MGACSVSPAMLVAISYEASFAQKKLAIVVLSAPDGRLEQYAVYAK
jgi:hypothetical protein